MKNTRPTSVSYTHLDVYKRQEEYIAIQHCESGHDYTIYSPDFALLDGGQIDNHSLEQVTYELLMEEIKGTDLVKPYDYDTLMEQVEAAQQKRFEKNELGEVQSPSVSMLPESPEQALDEYPMPDPVLTLSLIHISMCIRDSC